MNILNIVSSSTPPILKNIRKISKFKKIFRIILITSNRFHTLQENLKFIDHAFKDFTTRITIFVYLPQNGFNLRNYVRNISLQKRKYKSFYF